MIISETNIKFAYVILVVYYWWFMKTKYALLKVPHPFKGMMAFSSDIDGSNLERYKQVRCLFDSYEIPFADTFWYYNSAYERESLESDTISFFKGLSSEESIHANYIIDEIATGNIDALHTYGNWSEGFETFTRRHAETCLSKLDDLKKQKNIEISVWISHGDAHNHQNIAQEGRLARKYQQGDLKKSEAYHTDILSKSSVRFVWARNQGTIRLIQVLKKIIRRLWFSYENKGLSKISKLIKELISDLTTLIRWGCYNRFGNKTLIFPIKLRDGSAFIGFERYTDNWHLDKLHIQLSRKNIEELTKRNLLVIVANHFGFSKGKSSILVSKETKSSLEYVSSLMKQKTLLITRQSELLNYNLVRDYIDFKFYGRENKLVLMKINDPVSGPRNVDVNDLRGLSFIGLTDQTSIFIGANDVSNRFKIESNVTYCPWT